MIKCIVIDDEPKARNLLKAIIEDYCPDLELVALCEDLPNGVKAIKREKPKLVFLDIEMPGHSGLELLEFFNDDEINFNVIFTTAYNEFALKAFKFSAIDYLLKPLEHTQVIEAVERFKKVQDINVTNHLKQFQQNMVANKTIDEKRIIVHTTQNIHFLKPTSIVMIKGEAAYSEIYLDDNTKLLASKNLKHFQDILTDIPQFSRCHKSYIINKMHIKQYSKLDGGVAMLTNNLTAQISVDKLDELVNSLR
ncbi:MAG: LytR/AlgR family response regulator transcription factor [Chitinophagaceae bacterium]